MQDGGRCALVIEAQRFCLHVAYSRSASPTHWFALRCPTGPVYCNRCRDCPGFWNSREMRQSVEDGAAQLLGLDPSFWSKVCSTRVGRGGMAPWRSCWARERAEAEWPCGIHVGSAWGQGYRWVWLRKCFNPTLLLACPSAAWQELLRWLEDRHSAAGDRLHALLCRCLEQGPWRQHCQRLLQLLPHQDLLPFALDLLGGSSFPEAAGANGGGGGGGGAGQQAAAGGGAWLVFLRAQWQSLDALVLAAALGCSLPLLLRLLRDEEWEDERRAVEQLVRRLLLPPACSGAEQPEQAAEQQQKQSGQQLQQQQQQSGEHQQQQQDELDAPQRERAAGQHVVAHWCLRRQLAQQRSAASDVQLQEMLLLHLFAAAFLVQQLASSSSQADTQQLQEMLTCSGLPCELLATSSPGGRRQAERGKRRRHSGSHKHKHSKRRHSSKHKGSSRKERRRKKRRRRSGDSSNDSSISGSDSEPSSSDGEGEGLAADGFFAAAAMSSEVGEQRLWRVRRPDCSSSIVSSLELVDWVVDITAWAHARWLFGRA